jgi:hypothetical protein
MSGFVSRWVVRQQHRLDGDALTADGLVRDDTVARWVAEACDAYLVHCRVLAEMTARAELTVRKQAGAMPDGEFFGRPRTVVVSAGVTEFYPTSFTIAVRVRSYGRQDDDVVANVRCVVDLEDPTTGEACELGDAVRDELIALEHAARHTN